jgi:thiol-disulfide isomerase/thioredoxin
VSRALLLLLAASFGASAQSIKPGQPAPPLVVTQTIPRGIAVDAAALRGTPVVLEFWATWCANCVAEIPHLNALASQFEAIRFLSVTDEPLATVEPFLSKQPMRAVVALDQDGATFKAYGVDGRPQTVLIDKDGVVRAVMHPAQVDAALLADLEANRPLKPDRLPARLHIFEDRNADPIFSVTLRPSGNPKPGGVFAVDAGKMEGTNIVLKTILAYAYSVGERRIEGAEVPLKTRYDFCVLLPDGIKGDRELLREMLERSFQLKIRHEFREVDALVMTSSKPPVSTGAGQTSVLESILEARFNRVVFNETGLESYPWFELPAKNEDLADALRRRLGMELSFQHRTVEFVVVESLQLPTFRMGAPGRN